MDLLNSHPQRNGVALSRKEKARIGSGHKNKETESDYSTSFRPCLNIRALDKSIRAHARHLKGRYRRAAITHEWVSNLCEFLDKSQG
jgi:hypothetical protein